MEKRQLGKSGIQVPVVGMGTWKTFDVSGNHELQNCQEIVQAAFDRGSRFYDSSPMYGRSEKVLGNAVIDLGIRSETILATKIWTSDFNESIVQINNSLDYFGGYIDLYQIHNLVAWEKRLDQLEKLKSLGKVKSIGITHYVHSIFGTMMKIMQSGRIEAIQIPYNVIDRLAANEIIPLAAELNIGVIIMQPFGTGKLLNKKPTSDQIDLFKEFGVNTWAQCLLKWILSDQRVTVVIPATSHVERMIENTVAGSGRWFDAETRKRVENLAEKL